jgi:uncharacterized protein YdeI (YjbR/CyaY-like superfamily)
MSKNEAETYYPKSQQEWRNWLEKNHQKEQSIWLVYFKASTKVASLSWNDAVDEALCFGWIDSTKKTIDQERYMQYFSKRKPKSNWSKINKEKVEKLTQSNQMTQAGFDSITIAKQNGSWSSLDEVEALIMPDDLTTELAKHKGAFEYFDSLSISAKKILLYWVISAKRADTKQKRIQEIAENASLGLKPKQFR